MGIGLWGEGMTMNTGQAWCCALRRSLRVTEGHQGRKACLCLAPSCVVWCGVAWRVHIKRWYSDSVVQCGLQRQNKSGRAHVPHPLTMQRMFTCVLYEIVR